MASTVVSLGDVAEFIRGINFKPDDVVPLGTPDTVACLRTSNVQAELDLSDVWAVPKPFVKRPEQFVRPGDILVSSANSWNLVGKCCWIPELAWQTSFGGFVSVLRPNPREVEPRFLYRWFASGRIQALLRSFGRQTTNISNLNIERSRQLQLALPPLPEQRRIAAILDKAAELRAKRRATLDQLNSLTQAMFFEMFGDPRASGSPWEVVLLGDVCRRVVDGTHKTPTYTDSGVPFVTVKNIAAGELAFEGAKFISEEEHALLTKRVKPEKGDVLVSKDGTIGIACPVRTDTAFSIFVSVALLKLKHEIVDTLFLTQQFRTDWIQAQIRAGTKGIAIKHLHLEDFKKLKVVLPPLAMQRELVKRLAQLERVKKVQWASQADLSALFSSLQDCAFAGEL